MTYAAVAAEPCTWPYDGRWCAADSALVVIDMQHDFVGEYLERWVGLS